jgi:hypothetical protein
MLSRAIKNGEIVQGIFNQTHSHAAVAAYVVFPAGRVSAPQPHRSKVKFTLGTATPVTQCIAAGVQFESDEFPDGNITVVITHHDDTGTVTSVDRFPHNPANQLIVENVSGGGVHFHEYLRLTGANLIAKVEKAEDCPDGTLAEVLFTSKMRREQEVFVAAGEHADPTLLAEAERFHTRSASVNPECTNSQWP